MAFKLVSSGGDVVEPTLLTVEASGAVAVGDHVGFTLYGSQYTARRYVSRLNAPTEYTLFAIAASALASGTGWINVIPITGAQLWEADGTATVLTSHLFKPVAIELNTVANALIEGSAAAGAAFVFMPTGWAGAAADKKVLGKFINPRNLGGV